MDIKIDYIRIDHDKYGKIVGNTSDIDRSSIEVDISVTDGKYGVEVAKFSSVELDYETKEKILPILNDFAENHVMIITDLIKFG